MTGFKKTSKQKVSKMNLGQLVDDVRTYYTTAEAKERELLKALILTQNVETYQPAFA